MPASQITVLGAIAGLTVYLGLPLGRLRAPAPRLKAYLGGVAIGILIFLLWDVLSNAWGVTDAALSARHFGVAAGYGTVMLACVAAGLLGLVYFDRLIGRRARKLAAERFPSESNSGLALYTAMRAIQIRRLRVPKPRVKPGDSY